MLDVYGFDRFRPNPGHLRYHRRMTVNAGSSLSTE
jgi:hypothetical protein